MILILFFLLLLFDSRCSAHGFTIFLFYSTQNLELIYFSFFLIKFTHHDLKESKFYLRILKTKITPDFTLLKFLAPSRLSAGVPYRY